LSIFVLNQPHISGNYSPVVDCRFKFNERIPLKVPVTELAKG
jgi:hypothetical protein